MKIEKDQILLSGFLEKLTFHRKRGAGHLVAYLKNRLQWHWYPRLGIIPAFPLHVDVEVSTHCNMSCPMCYRRTARFNNSVEPGFMKSEVFARIIKECADNKLFSVRLSLRGEPFLHPEIFDFIAMAKKSGIKEASLLTNGLALTPEKFKRLVALNFDWLTISFDGLGKTYESIRTPARFNEELGKIKTYHRIKKEQKSRKPAIRIQAIWPAIKDNPGEFYQTFSPYVDSITSNPYIDFLQLSLAPEFNTAYICPYLYQRLVIGADARVLLCPSDEYGEYIIGNAAKESIYDIWHGDRLSQARDWFRKRSRKWWQYPPCNHCCYPLAAKESAKALINKRRIDIKRYGSGDIYCPVIKGEGNG